MKKKNIFLIFLFATTCNLQPATSSAAPQGASFLKIPVGARAAALGGAFSALVDDASALYWNPAGMAYASRIDLVAAHNEWIADTRQQFVGFLIKPLPFIAAGAGMLSMATDPIDKRGDNGEKLGSFTAEDRAVYLSGAMQLTRFAAVGGSIKNITQTIDGVTAQGQAVDVGAQLKPHRKITLGGSIQNIGAEMRFIKEAYSLPAMMRAGAGIRISPAVTLAADVKKDLTGAQKMDWATGIEYNLGELTKSYFWSPVVWRLGYLSPQAPGIGFGMKILGSQLDYALASIGPLGITHRLSFHLKFGQTSSERLSAKLTPESLPTVTPAKAGVQALPSVSAPMVTQQASAEPTAAKQPMDPRVFDWLCQKGQESSNRTRP